MLKEPTRHQISSKLSYQAHTPLFLQKFKNKVQGIADEDEDEPQYEDEYYDDGSGRPPIPQRPRERAPIPQRPDDDPGSADEESGEEKPQVVVLREGKHLTERQVENERRKERGLAELTEEEAGTNNDDNAEKTTAAAKKSAPPSGSLSFSSGSSTKPAKRKRKVIGDAVEQESTSLGTSLKKDKKPKKQKKTLLSFGDDA